MLATFIRRFLSRSIFAPFRRKGSNFTNGPSEHKTSRSHLFTESDGETPKPKTSPPKLECAALITRLSPTLCNATISQQGFDLDSVDILGSMTSGPGEVTLRADHGALLVKAMFDKPENRAIRIQDCENLQSYTICGSKWGRNGQMPAIWIWTGTEWSGSPKWSCSVSKRGGTVLVEDFATSTIMAKIRRRGSGFVKSITGVAKTTVSFKQGADILPLLVLAAFLDDICGEVFEEDFQIH